MEKRKYLKIASIIEFIYCILNIIYYLVSTKSSDEKIAYIFLAILGITFSCILFNISRKNIEQIKENKILISISGIWMFIDSIVPGILCYLFLRSLNIKKEKLKLPEIKKEERSFKSILKAIALIGIFYIFMYLIPSLFKNYPAYLSYIIIFISTIILCFKDLKNSFLIFIKNKKTYILFIVKRYFIMIGFLLLVAIPITLLNNGNSSVNQQSLNSLFKAYPLFIVPLVTLYAPIVEEAIFRLSISKLINNKWFYILFSGILFGYMHMVGNFSNIKEFLFVLEYSAIGICLSKAYYDSNNIFTSIFMHFIQNTLAVIMMFLIS